MERGGVLQRALEVLDEAAGLLEDGGQRPGRDTIPGEGLDTAGLPRRSISMTWKHSSMLRREARAFADEQIGLFTP
jgi:hypothetical protein